MTTPLRSISEINSIEEVYLNVSAPTLELAYKYLYNRIDYGFRDLETVSRFLGISYYSRCEPEFLTGLAPRNFANDIKKIGDLNDLDPEIKFFILFTEYKGLKILDLSEDCLQNLLKSYMQEGEPGLIRSNAEYILGLSETINEGYKNKINVELRARYYGRGLYGSYILQHGEL